MHWRPVSGRALSRLLCLLLILPTWQVPLPWLHSHENDEASVNSPDLWLVTHLRDYHATTRAVVDVLSSWHLHLVLPLPGNTPENNNPHSPETGYPEFSRIGETANPSDIRRALLTELPIDSLPSSPLHAVYQHLIATRPAPRWFLEDFATSLARSQRLCVALC